MKGLELSRKFYFDCVKPLIESRLPEIAGKYAAALAGYGSDVTGNDDEISRDHEWGPRCHIFLEKKVYERFSEKLDQILADNLPLEFAGFPTRFIFEEYRGSVPSKDNTGYHHVVITTPERFLELTIGIPGVPGNDIEWLGISEQRLLEFTSGEVFEDPVGELTGLREKLAYFPEDVWRYRIAFTLESLSWDDDLISECGIRGDDISVQLNTAKTVERIMRLVFLLNRKYAPLYPKWLHREFMKLPGIARDVEKELLAMLETKEYLKKTEILNRVYEKLLPEMKNRNLCGIHPARNKRDSSGIHFNMRTSAKDVLSRIQGELKEKLIDGVSVGAIDQWMYNQDIIVSAEHIKSLLSVYKAKSLKKSRLDRHI